MSDQTSSIQMYLGWIVLCLNAQMPAQKFNFIVFFLVLGLRGQTRVPNHSCLKVPNFYKYLTYMLGWLVQWKSVRFAIFLVKGLFFKPALYLDFLRRFYFHNTRPQIFKKNWPCLATSNWKQKKAVAVNLPLYKRECSLIK